MNIIKQIKATEYEEAENLENTSELQIRRIEIFHYNSKGEETRCDILDKDGKISCSWFRKYNDDGILIEKFNDIHSSYKMEIDKKGLTIAERFFSNGIEEFSSEYQYDSENKITIETSRNEKTMSEIYYYYDSEKKLSKKVAKNSNRVRTSESLYSNGNLNQISYYNSNFGIPTMVANFFYDKYNNIITQGQYSIMAETFMPGKVTKEQNEYKYDLHNNWIQKINKNNYNKLTLTNREIEYYK
tara:strand:+ start:259 stop:987 length:729 start_codon:yes stop_codon:yes gene_type:complete